MKKGDVPTPSTYGSEQFAGERDDEPLLASSPPLRDAPDSPSCRSVDPPLGCLSFQPGYRHRQRHVDRRRFGHVGQHDDDQLGLEKSKAIQAASQMIAHFGQRPTSTIYRHKTWSPRPGIGHSADPRTNNSCRASARSRGRAALADRAASAWWKARQRSSQTQDEQTTSALTPLHRRYGVSQVGNCGTNGNPCNWHHHEVWRSGRSIFAVAKAAVGSTRIHRQLVERPTLGHGVAVPSACGRGSFDGEVADPRQTGTLRTASYRCSSAAPSSTTGRATMEPHSTLGTELTFTSVPGPIHHLRRAGVGGKWRDRPQ